MTDFHFDAEPEWAIAYIAEYVAGCLCAATVGIIIALVLI